ncbi:MAG: very short patch repair endonuclease [bacterium]|nr:very short patch repair endonuclease [bacterium]
MVRTPEQISYNMSRIRSTNTRQENKLCTELYKRGIFSFERHAKDIPGCPDLVFRARRAAVFCDGDFWHGYDWEHKRERIKSNRGYWIPKIERNMVRDKAVTYSLGAQGWKILRFWEHDIKNNATAVADTIVSAVCRLPQPPYRLAELNAGIGELRLALEQQAACVSVLAAEAGCQARKAYAHQFGSEPLADLRLDALRSCLSQQSIDIILAHLTDLTPSQLRRYKRPPLNSRDILNLIERARPCAFLLTGTAKLINLRDGNDALSLVRRLIMGMNYHLAGIRWEADALSESCLDGVRLAEHNGAGKTKELICLLGFDRERVKNADDLEAVLPAGLGEFRSKEKMCVLGTETCYHIELALPDFLNETSKNRLLQRACQPGTVRPLLELMIRCLEGTLCHL